MRQQLEIFPQGKIIAEIDSKLAGAAGSAVVL